MIRRSTVLLSLPVVAALASCAASVPPVPLEPFVRGDLEPVRTYYAEQLAEGDEDSVALFLNGQAWLDMVSGELDAARRKFVTAGRIMGDWQTSQGEVISALVGSESSKTWKGDPHEKAMNAIYTGFLFWVKGEIDNARASFKNGIFADAESDEGEAQVDFALLYWLAGRASLALGDRSGAEDYFKEARQARGFAVANGARGRSSAPILTDPGAGNLICLVECGLGPRKVAGGPHGSLAMIEPRRTVVETARVFIDGDRVGESTLLADLDYQASTRGGKVMEGIREGKAVFKTASGTAGAVLIADGLNDSGDSRDAKLIIGGSLLALSLLTRAEADTRSWEILPQSVQVLTADVAPGEHVLRIEFLAPGGAVVPSLVQEWAIDVPETGDAIYMFRSVPGLDRLPRPAS